MTDEAPDEPAVEPEVHVTAFECDEFKRDVTTAVFHFNELLAPTSPFIDQPEELTRAVRRLDGQGMRHVIIRDSLLGAKHFDAFWAVSQFFNSVLATGQMRYNEAVRVIELVEERIGAHRLNHARRLGTLVYGIAVGSLSPSHYTEVYDFVDYVCTKADAAQILGRIERRPAPTTWFQRLVDVVNTELRHRQGITELPVIPAMPTMTEEFGPKELVGYKD